MALFSSSRRFGMIAGICPSGKPCVFESEVLLRNGVAVWVRIIEISKIGATNCYKE